MSKESKALLMVNAEDLSKVDDNMLNEKQLQFIMAPTPKNHIQTRPAKGGGEWTYVSGVYIRKVLNLMFGWNWSFEILEQLVMFEQGEVIVKGKLTITTGGQTIVKMQFGNKDIAMKRGGGGPLSIGNDMKAAATDALKKCASELGIASDIYGPKEFKPVKVKQVDDLDIADLLNEAQLLLVDYKADDKGDVSDMFEAKIEAGEADGVYLTNLIKMMKDANG